MEDKGVVIIDEVYERPEAFWTEGSTSLHAYESLYSSKKPLLLIPSLINSPFILDITPNESLTKNLCQHYLPILINWGEPTDIELEFNFFDYINRLERIIKYISLITDHKINLLGYCAGGLMALGVYKFIKEKIGKMILLATPWDFNATKYKEFVPNELEDINFPKRVSPEIINYIFYLIDPEKYFKKDKLHDQKQANLYKAVENWKLSTTSLSGKVLKDWAKLVKYNELINNNWQLGETLFSTKDVDSEVLIIMPEKDNIIPSASTMPLIEELKNVKYQYVSSGHIAMIIHEQKRGKLIKEICDFLL